MKFLRRKLWLKMQRRLGLREKQRMSDSRERQRRSDLRERHSQAIPFVITSNFMYYVNFRFLSTETIIAQDVAKTFSLRMSYSRQINSLL